MFLSPFFQEIQRYWYRKLRKRHRGGPYPRSSVEKGAYLWGRLNCDEPWPFRTATINIYKSSIDILRSERYNKQEVPLEVKRI